MNQSIDNNTDKKVYTIGQVILAIIINPVCAGWLLINNFRALNNPKKIPITWVYSILFFVFMVFSGISEKKIFIPALLSGVLIFNAWQRKSLKSFIENGGNKHSWWRAVGIILLLLIIQAVILYIAMPE